jgi:4-hydroxybenzoyl-CoA thioesterase
MPEHPSRFGQSTLIANAAQGTLAPIDVTVSRVFHQTRVIRFSDCDPAGIVFFPQYFIMLNAQVEDWFTHALGVNYAHLLGQRRIGLPTVALQSEFRAPCRMGDVVEFRLQLERMGGRSLTLRVDCMHGTTCCVQIRQVLVSTSLAHDGAIDIPQDVRESIARWQSFTGDSI